MKKTTMQVTTKDRLFVKMISERLKDLAFVDEAIDLFCAQLKILTSAFSVSTALSHSFSNPLIEEAEKKTVVSTLLAEAEAPLIQSLLKALGSLNKLYLFPLIAEDLEDKIAQQQGRHVAHIKTTFPLDDLQNATIVAALEKHFGGDITLKNEVDPKVLGGFVLRLGSRVLDASLLKDFYVLKNQMKGLGYGADNG